MACAMHLIPVSAVAKRHTGRSARRTAARFVRIALACDAQAEHNSVTTNAERMRIRVGCEFEYASEAAVPMLMMVRAQPDGEQRTLYESRWTEPRIAVRDYVDAFGNHCWRFTAPAGPFRIRCAALVPTTGA